MGPCHARALPLGQTKQNPLAFKLQELFLFWSQALCSAVHIPAFLPLELGPQRESPEAVCPTVTWARDTELRGHSGLTRPCPLHRGDGGNQ